MIASEKHQEALSHIKAVRYLDKEAEEARAAATIIQARFRGYMARSVLVREIEEAKEAEARAAVESTKVAEIERRKVTVEQHLKKMLSHYPKDHEKVVKARQKLAQVRTVTSSLSTEPKLAPEVCCGVPGGSGACLGAACTRRRARLRNARA